MSMGTFADRESRSHVTNILKQKKVVFGERPSDISSLNLMSNEEVMKDNNENSLNEEGALHKQDSKNFLET